MAQCKHDQRVYLTEFGTSFTEHALEAGRITHQSDYGDYTGVVRVQCHTCGLDRYYTARRWPKWVRALHERLTDPQHGEEQAPPGLPRLREDT